MNMRENTDSSSLNFLICYYALLLDSFIFLSVRSNSKFKSNLINGKRYRSNNLKLSFIHFNVDNIEKNFFAKTNGSYYKTLFSIYLYIMVV